MDRHMPALDFTQMSAQLDASLAQGLNVLKTVDSTNGWLLQHIQQAAVAAPISGQSCFAEEQTLGRGRRGRVWKSIAGGDITFSMAWSLAQSGLSGALTLAAAVSVATTLEKFANISVSIKWPNDIYYNDRKLVGILAEGTTGTSHSPARPFVIIGCGVNISAATEAESARIGVADILDTVDRNGLAVALLTDLAACMQRFDKDGLASFVEPYNARDYLQGRSIVVHESNRQWRGQSAGIASDGGLQVDDESGLRHLVHAADVTIRW